MKGFFTTKRLCRAGIIAALYAVLTYVFGALSSQGVLQIRPAEALCVLPLFYAEAVPALFVGCVVANILSVYGIYDVLFGSLATLVAAILTYFVGKLFRNIALKIAVGGIFPVLVNTLVVPLIIVFFSPDYDATSTPYWLYALSIFLSETVWVYALGTPLALFVRKMQQKGVSAFANGTKNCNT